ncbi:MAG: HD domain-containing phosphohydrolase [Ruminiclostridium sp.]
MKPSLKKLIAVITGIVLNISGRLIAQSFGLPIWLDMTGTFVAADIAGFPGALIAALSANIFFGTASPIRLVYCAVGVIAAALITYFVKKGYLLNPLRAALASFWLGIICTIASTPINLIFFEGYTGNSWGDTLVDMLIWYDAPHWAAAMAGQAIVEVVDKQICVLIACLITLTFRLIKKHKDKKMAAAKTASLIAAAGIALSGASLMFGVNTSAEGGENAAEAQEEEEEENDSAYLNFVENIYDNTTGMISSEANVICETDDGYIWVGSYAGLTRYDGNQFEFIREGGLVNVVGMMTDSKGRLWIGTNDAGIARYENGEYTYFTEKDGLPTNSVRCFAEDNEGNVYVGTSEKICKFDADDNIEISSQDINFVKYMTVYKDMLVVMDNNGCVYAIDGDRKLTLDSAGMGDYFYYCLAPTSKGLMLGTETGELFSAEITTGRIVLKEKFDIGADQISAIFEDSSKRIWIAQRLETGYIGQDGKYQRVKFKGFDSSIVYFHEDYQGNLWLASSHYGVMKLSESPFLDVFEKAGVSSCVVNAVEYYDRTYICGTDNGIVAFDKNGVSDKFAKLRKMTDGYRVRCLYADIDGSLWVCTYGGLFRYNPDGSIRQYTTETDKVTSDRFRCIIRLSDGTVAAGTSNGINFFTEGELTAALDSGDGLANTQILCLAEGPDGSLWAGSDGSGIYVISEGGLIKNYTAEDGLSSEVVLRIVPHEDGFLIVTSNALCHMDSNGNINRLSDFPYFNNYDIIINGKKAYVTCSAGLYETTVSELCSGGGNYKLYSAGEGLLSGLTANSWNYLTADGRLFLCSNSGVIVFSGISGNEDMGMKYGIVSAECDGKPLEKESEYTYIIPPGAKDINIGASVRNYAFTDVGVRFYVKELENNPRTYSWNEIEHVKIFKPDSPQYSVCLQILDSTGEKVLQETTYTLHTEMKPWEEPGFRTYLIAVCAEAIILALVSLVGIVFFVTRKNELEKVQTELEEKIEEQTSELIAKQNTIKAMFIQTVTALSEAVDAKDRYTSGHSKRVAEYSRMIAARMGKTKEEQEEIYRAGLLHDVGKIRVPVEIINKAGKLTDEEYDIIKIHPVTGYHILRGISGSKLIAISAKYHHERYDGKGYPNGLEGDRIPEAARILGVADAYDAMTSNRSYRKALPQEVVRAEIEKGRGTQFDPAIADVMLRMIDEDTEYTMKQGDFSQKRILTVDDEIMNSKLIARIMKDEPMYEIVSATSGKQALEILDEQEFDLIMLDVNMPEMDGLETLRLIRKKYQTPVVLMTGDKSLDTSVEFAALGCDDYVTKPFLAPLIKEIVHNMTECINISE